jgi:tetrapyrrole methylase family protein / MazG family protein
MARAALTVDRLRASQDACHTATMTDARHETSDRPSPVTSLDRLLVLLDLPAHRLQAFDPDGPAFDAQRPLLVLPEQFEAARPQVRLRYPPGKTARVVDGNEVREVALAALPFDAAAWLLPALRPEEDRRSLAGLRAVMEHLFGPDGCPWDREQTHESLRRFLLEEVYELVDAIDRGDTEGLREEIGDVLAHMFMQASVAQRAGAFTLDDAVEYATDKFVRRHPHVFGDEQTDTPEALLGRWEEIKRAEREAKGEAGADEQPAGALDSVPLAAPALQRVNSMLGRAQRSGLGEPPEDARTAARQAIEADDVGALLFATVRLARELGVDAEDALRDTATRFASAFADLEGAARSTGVEVTALTEDERRSPWQAVRGGSRGTRAQ